MKTEVMDLKKAFENRCAEFKKQVDDFKKNNEAMEALKKAHAKEIAQYVQEHNKKYNELLTDKLNSEDALRAEHKQATSTLNKEWQAKLADTVGKARAEEQDKARAMLERT